MVQLGDWISIRSNTPRAAVTLSGGRLSTLDPVPFLVRGLFSCLVNIPAIIRGAIYMNKDQLNTIANRKHRIIDERMVKLDLNLLALKGGRPYVDRRLTRFPGESSIDWGGAATGFSEARFGTGGISVAGRKQRAYLVNHAARVAEKIRQYVFAKPPNRDNKNPELTADITRRGDSLNAFMGDVLRYLVAVKWCWIGIDAPQIDGQVSKAEADSEKLRPYWNLYSPLDVVDWHFDAKGELEWLLTEGISWDNTDPMVESEEKCVRRLWLPGKVIEFDIEHGQGTESAVMGTPRATDLAFAKIPFVLCGEVSGDPHWYDDVEDVQRAILDMESTLDTLFAKAVFAQMVIPKSLTEDLAGENQGANLGAKVAAIVGLSNAICESETDKGITRYIGPPSGSVSAHQSELERKRTVLFDTVGLHLGFTKNFSESADAKQYDHLDPQAVLRNYSQQIAEAEAKAWKMTAEWDSDVDEIQPEYADKFRVSNIYEDFKSIVFASGMDLPDSVRRIVAKAALDGVLEISSLRLSSEEYAAALDDISKMTFEEIIGLTPGSMAGKTIAGVSKQATDDGEGIRKSGAE